ncbi:glycosyltransferase family 2 protein [Streptomyces parvulus]|nr:glycosyltransferase family 2 protein [Streptomyces parvulus]
MSGNLALREETSEQRIEPDPRGTPWLWWATRKLPEPFAPQERYGAAVVVHCHNDEYNLYEFLSSLAAQRDFERTQVVLVDDGSTDATPGHLANFAAHYPNTRVVPQVAMGLRAAYDHGLRYVTAPYVMFTRARDILGEDSVSHLLHAARRRRRTSSSVIRTTSPARTGEPQSRGSGTSAGNRSTWRSWATPPTSSSPPAWAPNCCGPTSSATSGCAAARVPATRTPGWPFPRCCTPAASPSPPRPPATNATRSSRTRCSTCRGTTRSRPRS